ncbi:hypothetical protein B0H21DRAFT_710263 [Amylocystis lapponica]|nr:hypothetical protein B0H21DRAFT_710263 [Amylocystis lapponica]
MPAVDISGIFGPALIGLVVAAVYELHGFSWLSRSNQSNNEYRLYGITSLQTYLYYVYYPKDRYELKFLVAAIWVLDTVQMVFACQGIYHYLLCFTKPGPYMSVHAQPWSIRFATDVPCCLKTSVAINVYSVEVNACRDRSLSLLSCNVASLFYRQEVTSSMSDSHQAHGRKNNTGLMHRICCDRTSSVRTSHTSSICRFRPLSPETVVKSPSKHGAATPFAVFAVVSDFVVAAALCVLLYKGRSDFKATNTLVHQLMVYAINRCLLTSATTQRRRGGRSNHAQQYATRPDTLWFLSFDFAIGKLYANSLLATLNTRHSLRDSGTDSVIGEPQLTTVRFVGLSALERSVGSGSMADSYLEH